MSERMYKFFLYSRNIWFNFSTNDKFDENDIKSKLARNSQKRRKS